MYNYAVQLDDEFCTTMFSGAYHPAFQSVKGYHVLLSIISMFSISYFFVAYSNLLAFHFNIKILFFFQFFACFLQAAILGIAQTHHLVLSLISTNPCDVVLPPWLYTSLNLPLIFSMLCMEFSQILMVIERTLPSYLLREIHKNYRDSSHGYRGKFMRWHFLRFCLEIEKFQIIVPLITCLYMYYDDEFDYPQMSAMATSPDSKVKVNYIFITINVLNFLTLMHSIGLYRHNQREVRVMRNRDHFILSTRYQMNENIISSKLLWWMSTAQLIIFLTYGCAMYSLRIFLEGPRSAVWQAVTELCYTPPLYCAVMPIICIVSAQNSMNDRNAKIQSLITLRSVGKEGWDNYQGLLRKQWA